MEYGNLVVNQLGQGHWPALRVVALRSGAADCVLPSKTISAPGLRYLETGEMSWKGDASPFEVCSSLKFVRGKRAASPATASTTWPLLRSHICRPAQHLTSLKIDVISNTHQAIDKGAREIELPSLLKLSVSATLSDQIIAWLNMFRPPKLEELRLITFVEPSMGPEGFHNQAILRNVKKLLFAMPIECLPLLLNGAPVETVNDLCFVVGSHCSLQPGTYPTIEFPSLQKLMIECSGAFKSTERANIPQVFFDLFDFSSASESVQLSLRFEESQHLAFPQVRRLRVDDLDELLHLTVPALRYLTIPVSETVEAVRRREDLAAIPEWNVPLHAIETLHLSGCNFPDLETAPGEGILYIAPNIINLVMSDLPSIITKEWYTLPVDWQGVEVGKRPSKLSLVFPVRKQGDSATYTHAARMIATAAKQLAQERRHLGRPLCTLAFYNTPNFLDPEMMFLGEVENLEIVPGKGELTFL